MHKECSDNALACRSLQRCAGVHRGVQEFTEVYICVQEFTEVCGV